MNEYEFYIKYKEILNSNKLLFNEVKVGNVLALDLWRLKELKYKDTIKEIIKALLFENYDIEIDEYSIENDILMLYSVDNRIDHKRSFDNVCKCIRNKDICIVSNNKKINLKKIKNIKDIIKFFSKLKFIKSIKYRLFIALRIFNYEYISNKIYTELKNKNYKNIVTFCDALPIENIVIQKSVNSCNVTLQHGQYIYQTKNKNINVLPYENFSSDYMLVWGESTVDELAKYDIDKSRLIVTGCPKFINNEENIIKEKIDNNVFGILLNNEQQNQSNFRMIELANEICKITGKKYILKMHPSNKLEDYINIIDKSCLLEVLDKNKTIFEYAKMVEFSIVHTSSVYVELNCINSPAFRYKDENYLSMYECDKDEFSSIDEFLEKYNIMMNDYHSWKLYMAEISKYFVNGIKGTKQRYKDIMNKIN